MKLFPMIILAGGLATRLRPITEKIPKALVEVGGKPFIYHQLKLLNDRGIKDVVISAGYLGDMIRDYVHDGKQFGMNIEYVFDGEISLGTGGAIANAIHKVIGPFFVLYGDSYLPCNYKKIQSHFNKYTQPALMTVYQNHDKWDKSNIEMVDNKIVHYDKKHTTDNMHYIDYGLGIFTTSVFDNIEKSQYIDLMDIYIQLIEEDKLLAYEVKERFYEIGSFDGLRELDGLLKEDLNIFIDN